MQPLQSAKLNIYDHVVNGKLVNKLISVAHKRIILLLFVGPSVEAPLVETIIIVKIRIGSLCKAQQAKWSVS